MVKLKITSIIIFVALFLNMTHDFILSQQTSSHCENSVQLTSETIKDSCCSKSVDIHKAFHFSAILSQIDIKFSFVKTKPLSKEFTPHLRRYCSTFKPPRA